VEGPRTRHGASSGLHANRRLQLQPPPTPATVPSGCTHHDRERRETRDEKESRRTADLRVTREVDPGSHAATSLTPPASLLHSTRGSPVNLNGSWAWSFGRVITPKTHYANRTPCSVASLSAAILYPAESAQPTPAWITRPSCVNPRTSDRTSHITSRWVVRRLPVPSVS
jgi:hypothetical protein